MHRKLKSNISKFEIAPKTFFVFILFISMSIVIHLSQMMFFSLTLQDSPIRKEFQEKWMLIFKKTTSIIINAWWTLMYCDQQNAIDIHINTHIDTHR